MTVVSPRRLRLVCCHKFLRHVQHVAAACESVLIRSKKLSLSDSSMLTLFEPVPRQAQVSQRSFHEAQTETTPRQTPSTVIHIQHPQRMLSSGL